MKILTFFKPLDFVGQTVIIFCCLSCVLFSPAAPSVLFLYFLGLFFLGGWQLTSALCHFLFAQDLFRAWYFMASITYCGILVGGVYLADVIHLIPSLSVGLGIVFFGIIPSIAGGWYYLQTLKGNP